jgi:hypothetical protein
LRTTAYILRQRNLRAIPHRRPLDIDWDRALVKAAQRTRATEEEQAAPEPQWRAFQSGVENGFLETMRRAHEWENLDLLLRGLQELGAKPLLLSMPINGPYFDRIGISPEAREAYYVKLRGMAEKYGAPVVDFRDHEEDPKFLADHHDHLSIEGWMYYNEVLDEFFHDRIRWSAVARRKG